MKKGKSFARLGFTLIELVVVTGIMISVSAISVTLLFGILKGSLKAEITKNTKQNGNYALSVMDRMIRNAKGVSVCEPEMTAIEIANPDDSRTTFSFLTDTDEDNITSSSANLISTGYTVSSASFDCVLEEDSPAAVTISFTLERGALSLMAEEKIKIPFKTTVTLRTY